ncbi:anaerobic ribonucleoside-triphosphate reductase activating protein [bacterium (Candidatus Gribaldobacteria) CG_4_10_14_0_8_um_filter_33_9]|uniref:Anaerobic ribonucleoside-triphosphate reductase activating protein n=1 Tax=bacterium (Candidatus Gribaldobacteria) CG_4_10_14_0_8_um_filter_33_9 TaxID=2014266 RepID=A0A2M7RNL8_9BACT|nr:MAG: anaerobic ribonucleoside-triphosphate reductase activating protein [bacterium (Candidatus Gribaldobacteria) CG_4_10_14_0_8_um_filter_33_9]
MQIGGLQKLSLIDYPGKIACAVFLIGCNFRCGYCHNPELVLPEKIKKQPKISEKDFFDFLKKRKRLIEGVVITGGEPTIHSNLPDFIKKIKKLGYLVKLDTNGTNPEMLRKLIKEKLVDCIAMDVKAPVGAKIQKSKAKTQNDNLKFNITKYNIITGVKKDLNKIKKSIEIIKNSDIDYEFRTTIIPTIHTKEDILQIAKDISPAKKYYIQNFKTEKTLDPKFKKIKPFTEKQLKSAKKEASKYTRTELR